MKHLQEEWLVGKEIGKFLRSPLSPRGQEELTLCFLLKVIAWKSPHLLKHSLRVASFSVEMAKRANYGFSSDEIASLENAALIHDVGKTAISDDVLNKRVSLTQDELRSIRQHTIKGYELIESLEMKKQIAETVLFHHENFDGSGYPSGKKAEEIPLKARILRLADVFDALTNQRVYRPSYNIDQAVDIIRMEQTFYDPDLLPVLIKMTKSSPNADDLL